MLHISFPDTWKSGSGNPDGPNIHPPIGTEITFADLKAKRWLPADGDKKFREHYKTYLQKLEMNGVHKLIIQPEHCVVR